MNYKEKKRHEEISADVPDALVTDEARAAEHDHENSISLLMSKLASLREENAELRSELNWQELRAISAERCSNERDVTITELRALLEMRPRLDIFISQEAQEADNAADWIEAHDFSQSGDK